MKKLINTNDKEVVFWEDEIEQANTYYDTHGETLDEIVNEYNSIHAFDCIGELKVIEVK
jgi:hypothetical protein